MRSPSLAMRSAAASSRGRFGNPRLLRGLLVVAEEIAERLARRLGDEGERIEVGRGPPAPSARR
jgi:hypothetical protein